MTVSEPATERGRATRARIVAVAAELVAERGVAELTLDDVGARAHASRSQLYHYFEDRDDLIRAVVDATTSAVVAAQDGLLGDLDSLAGVDRWLTDLEALQHERQGRGGCPIGSLVGQLAEHDPLARAALADGFDRWEGRLRNGFERMAANGELAADCDPNRLATAIMALLQGGLLLAQVRRDANQLTIALDAVRTVLRAAAD
jgi:AcrR family transcriptional regulator